MRHTQSWGVVIVAAALGLAGCSGGGASSTSHPIGDPAIQGIDVVARGGSFQHPLDAAPSPDGSTVYFVATVGSGPAVLRSSAVGGAQSTVAQGAPLTQPSGVAVATDGTRIYIADQRSGAGGSGGAGAILTASSSGGDATATVVQGTQGRAPRGLDIVRRGDRDVVYFTGLDPANAEPGLFEVDAAGGTVTTVAEGAPFASPDSVAVSAQGVAYVTDQGSASGRGQVFRVSTGGVNAVLTGLHLGSPAGVTLINGDATLLVSSLNSGNLSDQVLFLDLATGKTATAGKVIGAHTGSSGGLHRAYNAKSAAWADIRGTVYRVRYP